MLVVDVVEEKEKEQPKVSVVNVKQFLRIRINYLRNEGGCVLLV